MSFRIIIINSDCKDEPGVADGVADDVIGLINFMKGTDYFNYAGDCKINKVRDHVMGDIYHSQLIEIGPPDASLSFSDDNEEAYFRATNNYANFMSKNATRKNTLYAGSNSGLLHAIDAETGNEVWYFFHRSLQLNTTNNEQRL